MKVQLLNSISKIIYNELPAQYEVGADVTEPDAILVRSADMHALELPKSLLAIGRAGAGTNNIPVDKCAEEGIVVFNTPGANANAVRELVIAGLLLAGRTLIGGSEWAATLKGQGAAVGKLVEKGKSQFVGPELKGKKLGVIGMGAIGVLVANAAIGLDMQVVGYDPFMSVDAALHLSRRVTRVDDMDAIFAQCDYVTLHLPLNANTKGMVDEKRITSMKDGAVLLNFSRGELVDTPALLAALESGKLAKYGCLHSRIRGELCTDGCPGSRRLPGERQYHPFCQLPRLRYAPLRRPSSVRAASQRSQHRWPRDGCSGCCQYQHWRYDEQVPRRLGLHHGGYLRCSRRGYFG